MSMGWVEEPKKGREDAALGWEEGSLSSVEEDGERIDWERERGWKSVREDDGRPGDIFWDAEESEGLDLGEGEEAVQVRS